jgi:transposase
MLAVNPSTRCFICIEPIDGRKGIDGIGAVVRQKLSQNPMDGAWYLFRTRSGTTIKILFYDGSSFWLCLRRLSSGRIKWWPRHEDAQSQSMAKLLAAREINVILWNGDPSATAFGPEWKKI